MDFFDTADGFNYRPFKHWCFLAEIVDVGTFLRLRLEVKDRAGQISPLCFYTDDRGEEVPASRLRRGYTVAVLYAKKHGFLDMSVGIRHEEPKFLKVKQTSSEPVLPLTPGLDLPNRTEGAARAQRSRRKVRLYR